MSPQHSPSEDLQPPAAPEQGDIHSQPQLDMREVMRAAGGPNFLTVLHNTDVHMGPHSDKIPSERCGGEARRANLKRKARHIARSAAETFAFSTLRTVSIEEAADILETFGNVSGLESIKIHYLFYMQYMHYMKHYAYDCIYTKE